MGQQNAQPPSFAPQPGHRLAPPTAPHPLSQPLLPQHIPYGTYPRTSSPTRRTWLRQVMTTSAATDLPAIPRPRYSRRADRPSPGTHEPSPHQTPRESSNPTQTQPNPNSDTTPTTAPRCQARVCVILDATKVCLPADSWFPGQIPTLTSDARAGELRDARTDLGKNHLNDGRPDAGNRCQQLDLVTVGIDRSMRDGPRLMAVVASMRSKTQVCA